MAIDTNDIQAKELERIKKAREVAERDRKVLNLAAVTMDHLAGPLNPSGLVIIDIDSGRILEVSQLGVTIDFEGFPASATATFPLIDFDAPKAVAEASEADTGK